MKHKKLIKVQIPFYVTDKALLHPKTNMDEASHQSLTFHAYSDVMKARVLEMICDGSRVHVSYCDEKPEDGEWMENLVVKEDNFN